MSLKPFDFIRPENFSNSIFQLVSDLWNRTTFSFLVLEVAVLITFLLDITGRIYRHILLFVIHLCSTSHRNLHWCPEKWERLINPRQSINNIQTEMICISLSIHWDWQGESTLDNALGSYPVTSLLI